MQVVTNIDLKQNELQNVSLQKLATAPLTPVKGPIYYNTTNNKAYVYNGSSWIAIDNTSIAISDVTGVS